MNSRDFYELPKNLKIFEKKLEKINKKNLLEAAETIRIPDFLLREKNKLQKINLWASKKATKSKLHFDFYENFLFVLKGKKTVILFPPNCPNIKNDYTDEFYFHQGTIKFDETQKTMIKMAKKYQKKYIKNEILKEAGMLRIELYEGQMLYIPEGWHHYVSS